MELLAQMMVILQKNKKLSLHGMTKDTWNRFSENGKWLYRLMNWDINIT